MAIAERITSYSAWVGQTDYLSWTRTLRLTLESGTTVYLGFPTTPPADWLVFGSGFVNAFLTADQYDQTHHLLQTEDPVFFTGLALGAFTVAAVHTELDLRHGEPTGEGYRDDSLEALVVRAHREAAEAATS